MRRGGVWGDGASVVMGGEKVRFGIPGGMDLTAPLLWVVLGKLDWEVG